MARDTGQCESRPRRRETRLWRYKVARCLALLAIGFSPATQPPTLLSSVDRARVLLAKVLTAMAEANQQLTSAGPSRSGAKDIEGVGKFKVSERASAQGFGLNS